MHPFAPLFIPTHLNFHYATAFRKSSSSLIHLQIAFECQFNFISKLCSILTSILFIFIMFALIIFIHFNTSLYLHTPLYIYTLLRLHKPSSMNIYRHFFAVFTSEVIQLHLPPCFLIYLYLHLHAYIWYQQPSDTFIELSVPPFPFYIISFPSVHHSFHSLLFISLFFIHLHPPLFTFRKQS